MKTLLSILASIATFQVCAHAQVMTNGEYLITNNGGDGGGWVDNAAAFNNLINALPPSGGCIVIPNGTFRVNSPINVSRQYVTIRGMGPGSKILVAGGANQGILCPNQSPRLSGFTVRDLQIQGLDWNVYRTGISVDRANDGLYINNVLCNNMNRGFYLRECDAGRVIGNSVAGCESSLYMTGGFSTLVTRNTFSGFSGGTAVELMNLDRCNFTSNSITPDGRTSLRLGNAHACNVTGNTILTIFTGCIEVTGNMNTFSGNNITAALSGGSWAADPAGRSSTYGLIRISGNDNQFASSNIMSWQPLNHTRLNVVSGDRNVIRDLVIGATGSNKKINISGGTWCRITNSGWSSEISLNGNSTARVIYDP
jgi:parallel beta-helix repeat protein